MGSARLLRAVCEESADTQLQPNSRQSLDLQEQAINRPRAQNRRDQGITRQVLPTRGIERRDSSRQREHHRFIPVKHRWHGIIDKERRLPGG